MAHHYDQADDRQLTEQMSLSNSHIPMNNRPKQPLVYKISGRRIGSIPQCCVSAVQSIICRGRRFFGFTSLTRWCFFVVSSAPSPEDDTCAIFANKMPRKPPISVQTLLRRLKKALITEEQSGVLLVSKDRPLQRLEKYTKLNRSSLR